MTYTLLSQVPANTVVADSWGWIWRHRDGVWEFRFGVDDHIPGWTISHLNKVPVEQLDSYSRNYGPFAEVTL